MPLEIKKQSRETPQGLIRRFTRSVKKSGILVRARKGQYRQRQKSRQLKKRSALRREVLRKRYEQLKKIGNIE